MAKGKILLIGPRYYKDGTNVGGVIVLFEDLISYLDKLDVCYQQIDTNKSNYGNIVVAYVSILYHVLISILKSKYISLHGTEKDYLYIAPFVVFFSKLFNKKVSLRKFAGDFDKRYSNYSYLKRMIIKYVLKNSDVIFFETKKLVSFGKQFNTNCFWMPNSRNFKTETNVKSEYSNRFVFISQIKKTKGIIELLEASKKIPDKYIIDIYGPIQEECTDLDFSKYPKASYNGLLSPKDVIGVLDKYDVLILPTYHEGEGYPGIIIEAQSMGLPVISTRWNSIDEIVNDQQNGFLVKIKNSSAIVEAMLKFNKENYGDFSQKAINSVRYFESTTVYSNYLNIIYESK